LPVCRRCRIPALVLSFLPSFAPLLPRVHFVDALQIKVAGPAEESREPASQPVVARGD
jgi:hypothetical protein